MTKFISIVSGKGGVGKTTTTINLGRAIAGLNKNVTIVDCNFSTPNIGIHLGLLDPKYTLNHFLQNKKALHQVTYNHHSGMKIIPSSPSYNEFLRTNTNKLQNIFQGLNDASEVVLIDSPSGLGQSVKNVLRGSDEAILVVNPTLSSVMDALKTIQIAKSQRNLITGIILNKTKQNRGELSPHQVEQIMGHPIIGNIRQDRKIERAMHNSETLQDSSRWSSNARELTRIAKFLCHES